MLNLQSRLCKLVFAALVFSMVAFGLFAPAPGLAEGASTKSMTIDLTRSGKKDEVAGRSVTIWKLSDGMTVDESGLKGAKSFQDVTRLLDAKSDKELNDAYSSHKSYETDAEGKLNLSLERGMYYLRVADKKGATSIYPCVFLVIPGDSESVIYPKPKDDVPKTFLKKVNSENKPLSGAVFQLFRYENSNRIPVKDASGAANYTTDKNGEIGPLELSPGKYVFVEVKAPAGYRIKNPETIFDVKGKGLTEVPVVNYKDTEGGKTFKKVSSKDGKPLAGAQFLVTKKKGETYLRMKKGGKDMVLTSGADGTFVADGLPDGDYYLWEIKAPAGYEPLSSSVKFIVSADSLKKELVIKNNPQTTPPGKTPPGETPPGETPPYDDKHVNIPKTGDVQLLMMSVAGLLSGMLGVKILKDNE